MDTTLELYKLGLSARQVTAIKSRLSVEEIPNFIHRFREEKMKEQRPNLSTPKYIPRTIPQLSERSTSQIHDKLEECQKHRNDPIERLEMLTKQLFGELSEYSEEMLSRKYKDLAKKLHPDTPHGNEHSFQILNSAFDYAKMKCRDQWENTDTKVPEVRYTGPVETIHAKDFTNNDFNNFFEKNSYKEESHGHGNWLRTTENSVSQPKLSSSNFNNEYDMIKQKNLANSEHSMVKYGGVPVMSDFDSRNSVVLGEDKKDDYSGQTKSISYSDVKKVYNTPYLVGNVDHHDKNMTFEEAKTELHKSFGELSQMTEREKNAQYEFEKNEQENEHQRRFILRQFDENIQHHFQKMNNTFQITH